MDNLSANATQVLDTLAEIGHSTVADIRARTGKAKSTTDRALRELADAGLIIETDLGDGSPARWSKTAPAETTDHDPATDTGTDTAAEAGLAAARVEAIDLTDGIDLSGGPADTDASNPHEPDQPSNGTAQPADGTAVDTAQEADQGPARPKPPADRKVLAVAGVLGDYPDGATIDEIAEASGFNVGVVARLLQAMEQADAARRIPADAETGTPERWQPGPGKASEVDPNPAPPRCPTCHQVIRNSTPRATVAPRASGTGAGTVNSDGNEPLGRNVLRGWVDEFVNAHPGHELTPGTIAEALGAQHGRTISSGAVLNNCRTLAMNGRIQVARENPFTVTANPAAADHSGPQ